MIFSRHQFLFILFFLFAGAGRSVFAQKPLPQLEQAFNQADQVYQNDLKAGFQRFQLVYAEALRQHDPATEIKCLNLFTEYYWTERDYPQALAWGKQSMSRAEETGSDALAGDAYVLNGLVSYSKGQPLTAIALYQKAITHYQKLPESKRLALAYMNLGVAERKAGRYETANISYFKAADIFKNFNDQPDLASIYTAIGNCYALTENYNRAIIYHKLGLNIFITLKDQTGEAQVLDNLGYAFKMLLQPDSAIKYLDQVLRIRSKDKDSTLLVTPLQNLGSSWKQKGDLKKATIFIQRSIRIAELAGLAEELARGQADQAELYIAQKQFPQTDKALHAAGLTAKKLNLADLLETIADLNYQLQAALGHDRQALVFYRQRDRIRDSLLTAKKTRAIEDLEAKYQIRERERDNAELHTRDRASQKLLGQQRLSIIALISAAALLLALLALAFHSFRKQRYQNSVIRNLNKEINHRTKNNLQILSSLLLLQIENEPDEMVKQALQETEVRLQAMNIMYGKLYTGQHQTSVNMGEYIGSLLTHVQDGFSHKARKIIIDKDIDPVLLPTDKAVLLGLVINELSQNGIKHAQAPRQLIISVGLKQIGQQLRLTIYDSGKPKKNTIQPSGNSFGLRIVHLIAEQLDATIITDPNNPFAYRITFPF